MSTAAPIYALGALGFDFGSLERRDALYAENGGRPIITNADLASFLMASPLASADYQAVIWTLVLDRAPIYALRAPTSLDAWALYQALVPILSNPLVDRIAVPGRIGGDVTLLDGRVVPVIECAPRTIRKWSTTAMGLAVNLTGAMAPPAGQVNLTTDGTPAPSDWSSWNTSPPVHKVKGGNLAVTPIGAGGTTLLTTYVGSTIPITWVAADGTSPPPPAGAFAGTAASTAAGGLQIVVPADKTPRTLKLYARTFASSGQLVATLADGSAADYVDTSFDAFPAIAGLPGVVDGVYTITYRAQNATTLLVQFVGTPTAADTPNPLSVTLFAGSSGSGAQVQLPVGNYPADAIPATLNGIGSAYIPPGLRLTVYNADVLGGDPGTQLVGAALPASVTAFSALPTGVVNATKSLIVEAENYVGLQAASLTLAPTSDAPLVDPGRLLDFMDRVYDLLRNRGATSGERAINYAATQAAIDPDATAPTANSLVLANALAAGLALEAISAEPTLATRPGADCWDVRFTFLDPRQVTQSARTQVRITVDVATARPLTLTPARTWTAY